VRGGAPYARYLDATTQEEREAAAQGAVEPDTRMVASNKSFLGQMSAWQRHLHSFDETDDDEKLRTYSAQQGGGGGGGRGGGGGAMSAAQAEFTARARAKREQVFT